MTTPSPLSPTPPRIAALAMTLLLSVSVPALAGPGAHGPNGEHLDAPATAVAASAWPRLETRTDDFELVAELRAAELVIHVDRYETNEPVLGAKLEVETGGLKAPAAFRAEQGDYVLTDAAFLKALSTAGEHGLVVTLVAGADSDLLDGTLVTGAARPAAGADGHGHDHDDDHDHAHERGRAAWIGGGLLTLTLIGGALWWHRRRDPASAPKGAL